MPSPYLPLDRGPADAATPDAATQRRADGHLVSRLTIGAFQTLRPLRGVRGGYVGNDVGQVEQTLHPGEELVWHETTRGERIGLIIRPPADKQRWIVFFYGIGMTVAGTWPVRRWLGNAGYGVACVEYAGFGVSSGSPSEYGCYRSADAAITYLQRQASITLDRKYSEVPWMGMLSGAPGRQLTAGGDAAVVTGVYRGQPGGCGCVQACRSSGAAFQGRNRSSCVPSRGLPPLRPQASR